MIAFFFFFYAPLCIKLRLDINSGSYRSCSVVVENLWSPMLVLFYQIAIDLSATVNATGERLIVD